MPKVHTINARYNLTPEEKTELAESISKQVGEIEILEQEKSASAQDFSARIKAAKKRLSATSSTHRNGYDYRDQPAHRIPDFDAGLVRWYHAETQVLLREERMSYEERQRHLDFEGEESEG